MSPRETANLFAPADSLEVRASLLEALMLGLYLLPPP